MGDAAISDFQFVSPRDPLSSVVDLLLRGWQQDFPVVDQEKIVGLLKRQDIIATLASGGAHTTVNHSMRRDYATADADESLESVLSRMSQSQFETVPVLDGGRLVALLTHENVAEHVLIHSALYAGAKSRQPERISQEISP